MKRCISFLIFLAVATVIRSQDTTTTTSEPAFRSIKISFDALETLGGKGLWKIWLNLPTTEQECLQGAIKNEIRNYLSGVQPSIIALPEINQTCPNSFKEFKILFQQIKKKFTVLSLQAKAKLPKSVTSAMTKISYRI
jgi:hypothetical protein